MLRSVCAIPIVRLSMSPPNLRSLPREILPLSCEAPTLAPSMIPNPHDALVKVVFGKPEHA